MRVIASTFSVRARTSSASSNPTYRKIALVAAWLVAQSSGALSAASLVPVAYLGQKGSDIVSCGAQISPCRTLQYTLTNRIAPSGTIYLAESGDYGSATIQLPVTIVSKNSAPTGMMDFVAGANVLRIRAGAQDQVVLEGVTIDGGLTAAIGVNVTSAKSVTFKNCVIRNFDRSKGIGVRVRATTPTVIALQDTTIADPGRFGVYLDSAGEAAIIANLQNTRVFDAATGLGTSTTGGTVKMSVTDSLFMGNRIAIQNAGNGQLALEKSRLTANEIGLKNSGLAALATSTIAANSTGISTAPGRQTFSWGSSTIACNKKDIEGPGLVAASLK